MKDWEKSTLGIILVTAAFLSPAPLFAQQQAGERPNPAAREYPPLLDTADNQQDADAVTPAMQPDNMPLVGVQNPTLGTPEMRHSYWVPGIEYTNDVRSSSLNQAANSDWNTTSFVSVDMSLQEAWSHSLLSANYSGGGFFSTDPIRGNGQNYQLATAYEIDQRRWQVLFVDQFSYLPQSAFGFGGTGGLAFPGITGTLAVPLPGLQSAFVPSQTILTPFGPRSSNASAGQLTYAISRRGSITLAAVYGTLRFADSGNVNNDTAILNTGYNYAITQKDSVGLVYIFSAYHFPGDPQAIGDHVGQFVYGRKITGRLALKLAGGPEVTRFRVAIGDSTQKIAGSGNAALTYAFARSKVALSYTHGVSGGSGVFTGSTADLVNATWNRQLTRVWNWSVNFGYARNRQILSAVGLTPPSYDTWLVGSGLSRPLGRAATFSLSYQAQVQAKNAAICGNPTCGTNYTVHEVFATFQWHTRPLVLR
jgi:hypothetical protein